VKDTEAKPLPSDPVVNNNKPNEQLIAQRPAEGSNSIDSKGVGSVSIENTVNIQPASTDGSSGNLPKPSSSNVVFKVQFLVSKTLLKPDNSQFKGLNNFDYYLHNGLYKYTYGNEQSVENANQKVKELNRMGFKDCFVVAFNNDVRITVDEAVKLLGN